MKEAIENINIEKLQEKVDEFRLYLASLKTEEDYSFYQIQEKLLEIFKLSNYYDNIFELEITEFWRARPNDTGKLFLSPLDFEYPKWEGICQDKWRYDRFNLPGESMWYLSNSRNACISEIKPEKGSIVSCAKISYNGSKHLRFLLLGKMAIRNAEADPFLSDLIDISINTKCLRHSQQEIDALSLVDELMNQITTKKINGNNRFEYIPSIVVQKLPETQNCDGIIYPSIAFGPNAINYVLFPKAINERFSVDDFITFGVAEAEVDKFYGIAPLLIGKSFPENGNSTIKWQYPSPEDVDAYSYRIDVNPTL